MNRKIVLNIFVEEIHVKTLNGTSNDFVDNTDMEGPVFVGVQGETGAQYLPSTEMVTEVARSPSMFVKLKSKITEKRKTVKSNLVAQAFKMTRLAREKFPHGKVSSSESSSAQMLIVEDVIQETSW